MIRSLGIIIQAIIIVLVIGAIFAMVPVLGVIFGLAISLFIVFILLEDHYLTEKAIKDSERQVTEEPSKSERIHPKD